MTDTYAASRLVIWSEWILKKDSGATGFPSQSIYTKLVQIRGGIGFDPHFDEEAQLVDKFMTKLKGENKQLFGIISMVYCVKWVPVGNGIERAMYTNLCNQEAVGQAFGIARRTVSDKISKAHHDLLEFIHDSK